MDIAQVTRIARMMVEEWGMSAKLGFIRYAAADTREMFVPDKAYSDETARLIDEEVRRIVAEAYDDAQKLLREHWDKVVAVAEALLRHETLDAPDVHKLMRGEQLTRPTVSDLLAAEARRSRENAPATPGAPATPPPATEGPGSALPTPA
jgi:cell division protease FtsH